MSAFNCLAPCCVPPPPPECCLTLEEISSLFPSGMTLNFGSTTINIPNSAWQSFSSCCATATIGPFGSIPLPSPAPSQEQCTSLWSYNSSEEFRVKYMVREYPTVTVSGTEATPCSYPCPQPDLLEDYRFDVLIQKKGEIVFRTNVVLNNISVTIGKTFQTCSYGTPVCVYTLAVTFNYDYYISTPSQEYYYNQIIGTDILSRCGDASFTQDTTTGVDEFPVCNYLPDSLGVPAGSWSITRTKVLPTLTSPQVFDPDDPTPEWCDLPGACGAYPTDQTLELCIEEVAPRPIYVQRGESSYEITLECYFGYNFIDTDTPLDSRCYAVYTASTRSYTLELFVIPTPPDYVLPLELSITNPKALDSCNWVCQDDAGSVVVVCGGTSVGTVFPPTYQNVGYLVDLISFSYVGSSASLPVCHTYNSPNWTLTW
jgi:hypothetical protein